MEGDGGDPQSPIHRLHHLPLLPTWVMVRVRYGDHNPRGQTASACYGHYVGGPPHNLTVPVQGIQ